MTARRPTQRHVTPGYGANHPGAGYTDAQRQFLMAVDRYRCEQHRSCLSLCEVFKVLLSLGYRLEGKP